MTSETAGPEPDFTAAATREIAELADLTSIQTDLTMVLERCRLIQPDQSALHAALWEAALVAYRRAFTSGRPLKTFPGRPRRRRITDNDLAVLNPDDRAAHNDLLAEANRHIAHRVEEGGEEFQLHALRNNATGQLEAIISLIARRIAGPNDRHDQLERLAERLLAHVNDQLDHERATVLRALQASPHS